MEPVATSEEDRQTTVLNPQASRTDPAPLCSIVIPTYNGRALLETCLGSIFRHLPVGRAWATEIIVVDDASTDGTFKWVATHYPPVRLVHRPRNGGFCAAANAGLSAARGQFIQLLNNDTQVTPGWLEAGLAPFADPTVGSVAPWFWSAPTPVASIRRAMSTRWPAGPPSAATVSPPPIGLNARSKMSSPPAARVPFTEPRPSAGSADSTPCWVRIMRTSTLASAYAGPAIVPSSIRAAGSFTRSPPPTTTLSPHSSGGSPETRSLSSGRTCPRATWPRPSYPTPLC